MVPTNRLVTNGVSCFPFRASPRLEANSVALAKIGNGKLGYVGDVNGEEGSDAVVLAMCGF